MTADEIQDFLEHAVPPFVIETKGGRSYHVAERHHLLLPERSTEVQMLSLVIPFEGLRVVRFNAIESVQIERDPSRER